MYLRTCWVSRSWVRAFATPDGVYCDLWSTLGGCAGSGRVFASNSGEGAPRNHLLAFMLSRRQGDISDFIEKPTLLVHPRIMAVHDIFEWTD